QAAAGVGGVIKMVEAMRHGVLPKTLHVDEPTPHVEWPDGVRLLTREREWPESEGPRRAAVSSFGVSGTNAHAVLEQAPAEEPAGEDEHTGSDGPWLWPLSAKSEQALRAQADRLRAYVLEGGTPDPTSVGRSLATTRTHFPHRAVVVGRTPEELLDGLRTLADGGVSPGTYSARTREHEVVFLFSGQGGQYAGMGRELAERFPVFAEAFGRAAAEIDRRLGAEYPVADVAFGMPGTEGLLDRTLYTQTALFALQVGLFRLYEHWGVRPAVLVGH
ncbi:hypothetical protein ADK65_35625, partial [Streptomyces sp. NRRL B-1140]|uniref:acyltransferase domain-containing protein n=1 Tax=Streptomyces sp. NRRL B-1140 TaxID=1415549 RepID=UPI0006C2A9E4